MLRFFGFGRKNPSPLPLEVNAPPQANTPSTPPSIKLRPPARPSPPGPHSFQVKTRISKAVGKDGRYACNSVRALPSVHKGEVILQATDGHQATCVLTQGHLTSSRLVPASVLPSRQLNKPLEVRLIGGQWESMDGRTVEDKSDGGSFPTLGDVLPVVGRHPFHETTAQARQRQLNDPVPNMTVTLGLDIDLLRKAAEALGTSKLALFVPVPIKDANQKPGEVFVNKPVAVCPAVRSEQTQGISVVMPLSPEHGTAYYNKVREVIAASEKAAQSSRSLKAKPQTRRAG